MRRAEVERVEGMWDCIDCRVWDLDQSSALGSGAAGACSAGARSAGAHGRGVVRRLGAKEVSRA